MSEITGEEQLQELLELEIELHRGIAEIRQSSLASASVVPLCHRINQKFSEMERRLASLESASSKPAVLKAAERHKRELQALRREAKEVVAAYFREGGQRHQKHREELLGGGLANPAKGAGALSADALQALRRTHSLLSNELERTNETMRLLDAGSTKLRQTRNEFQAHRATIASSGGLLQRLKLRGITDAVLVYFAFAVFLGVCGYILRRRVFHFV
eukprot:RCo023441